MEYLPDKDGSRAANGELFFPLINFPELLRLLLLNPEEKHINKPPHQYIGVGVKLQLDFENKKGSIFIQPFFLTT